ncbi:unnamed protein product [Clonostachys chloroleuca]|uniref:Zn(2)-C6 fungal-type domain-containing protein n=1 Tax=Clonostachys chloroleuca TaxID=1926264 RepID=A0AA35PY22_9HYPO|nr:unnamed protein product [Clonostachys chloroleuca]
MTSQTVGRGITRNRERLACTECRRRKLKCNRSLPCSACTRRGASDSCTYQRFPSSEGEPKVCAEERLEQLEKVVKNLINEIPNDVSAATSSAWEETVHVASSSSSSSQQPGSTHLSSALEDIQELRSAIAANGEDDEQPVASVHQHQILEPVGILFGSSSPMTLQKILATYLPSRQNVDRLISAYFRAQSIAAPFIHSHHFRRLYASFWADPLRTSPNWIAILFSICHISINALKLQVDDGPPGKNSRFSQAAAFCLALGEYYRPKPFAVEALLLFIQSHCLTSLILPPDTAPVIGTLIRVATAMGYHQPPTRPDILTPFESEMRRRTWSLCMQLDLLVSFHLGLPSAMRFSSWPCEPPRNLSDSDFDESSLELPPSRPRTNPTGTVFIIEKHNFMVVFDKIQHHALSARSRPPQDVEDELVELDSEIRRVHNGLPPALKPLAMKDSVFDSPNIIVTRLCVTFLYCKCLIVLHRQHVLTNRPGSLRTCYEASGLLVRHFCDSYDEFAPGGQVESERWFMSSLTVHDFLLGAVALSLVSLASSRAGASYTVDRTVALGLLERSRDITVRLEPTRGAETGHVRQVIESTLQQLQASGPSSPFLPDKAMPSTSDDFRMDWDMGPQDTADSLWDEFLAQYLNMDGEEIIPF